MLSIEVIIEHCMRKLLSVDLRACKFIKVNINGRKSYKNKYKQINYFVHYKYSLP